MALHREIFGQDIENLIQKKQLKNTMNISKKYRLDLAQMSLKFWKFKTFYDIVL